MRFDARELRLLVLFPLVVASLICFPLLAFDEGPRGPVEFTLLHTSDIHAHLMPFDTASGTGMGGYARIKSYRDLLASEGREILMVSSGDVFQGTLFYRFFQGIPDVEFMNSTGYCAMALGNHEFDGGPSGIIDAFRSAQFPVLSANLKFVGNKVLADLVRPWTIVPVGSSGNQVRIGLLGLLDENLALNVPKQYLTGLSVERAEDAVRRELPRMRASGADIVIVLSHLGWNRDVEIAEAFPEISGICGGHTHLFVDPPIVRNTPFGQQFLCQPGQSGQAVGRLDLFAVPTPDGRFRLEVRAAGLEPMDSGKPEDPEIKKTIDLMWEQIREKVCRPVGEALFRLNGDRPDIRIGETNLGNFVADAFLDVASADIALVNGGGIRSSIEKGTITVGDCLNVLPFDNRIVTLEMTGASLGKLFGQVRAAMLATPGFGGFLQVSRGFGVRFGTAGNELSLNGKPLEVDQVYKVTTLDFLSTGGNGLTAFEEALASETVTALTTDALIKKIERLKKVDPKLEGRIVRDVKLPEFKLPKNTVKVPPLPGN